MILRAVRRATAAILRLLTDRRARSEWLTRLAAPRVIHQDVTQTWLDRYPLLFGAARDLIGDDARNILSFGCSSGEEVMGLHDYFPDAAIVGAELNRVQLAACRRLRADPRVHFIHSTRPAIAAHGPYDAIFAMAVFQRRPHDIEKRGVTDISRHYPFALFDDEVEFLAARLRIGGLLIVEHAQYRIEDTAAARLLEPLPGAGTYLAKGPRFGRDGTTIAPQPIVSRIFRKRRDPR